MLEWLRLGLKGEQKNGQTAVCSDEVGVKVGSFRTPWELVLLKAHGIAPRWRKDQKALTDDCLRELRRIDLRWHDLRHEYASRLVGQGVPPSQVRDLLGHAFITTTERYDNQTEDALLEPAKRLETGQSFKFLSTSEIGLKDADAPPCGAADANLRGDEELDGWGYVVPRARIELATP